MLSGAVPGHRRGRRSRRCAVRECLLVAHSCQSLTRRFTAAAKGRAAIGCRFGCYALKSSRSGCLAGSAGADPMRTFRLDRATSFYRPRAKTETNMRLCRVAPNHCVSMLPVFSTLSTRVFVAYAVWAGAGVQFFTYRTRPRCLSCERWAFLMPSAMTSSWFRLAIAGLACVVCSLETADPRKMV